MHPFASGSVALGPHGSTATFALVSVCTPKEKSKQTHYITHRVVAGRFIPLDGDCISKKLTTGGIDGRKVGTVRVFLFSATIRFGEKVLLKNGLHHFHNDQLSPSPAPVPSSSFSPLSSSSSSSFFPALAATSSLLMRFLRRAPRAEDKTVKSGRIDTLLSKRRCDEYRFDDRMFFFKFAIDTSPKYLNMPRTGQSVVAEPEKTWIRVYFGFSAALHIVDMVLTACRCHDPSRGDNSSICFT